MALPGIGLPLERENEREAEREGDCLWNVGVCWCEPSGFSLVTQGSSNSLCSLKVLNFVMTFSMEEVSSFMFIFKDSGLSDYLTSIIFL